MVTAQLPSLTHAASTLPDSTNAPEPGSDLEQVLQILKQSFDTDWLLLDRQTGERQFPPEQTTPVASEDQPGADYFLLAELAKTVSRPEVIAEESGLLSLAMPLDSSPPVTAIGFFPSREVADDEDISGLARLLSLTPDQSRRWLRAQEIWPSPMLMRLAQAVWRRLQAEREVVRLTEDIEHVSDNLSSTYEEICLLHGVTNHLRISWGDEQLGRVAVERVLDCIQAECVAIQYLPVAEEQETTYEARTRARFVVEGDCPLAEDEFTSMIDHLGLNASCDPLVANRSVTQAPSWKFRGVRQLIVVPLAEANNLFGWIAAINQRDGREFGSVEANLLNTLGAMLGVHCGNRELYRQQKEFIAAVVRALTSAIDAKDPYTCGHSDRVARVSVRLAQELGLGQAFLETIYMAGLLHDTGKIGIDDHVLRKPGKLTEEEFEHVKKHPEIGFTILRDLKQLADCMPAVLHHHEQWDGGGYPHGLAGERIPMIARIVAVADAYDAMHSDRPYRKGMPEDRVEAILRDGAGRQWDAQVIDAYFSARDDVREISRRERANLTLNVKEWMGSPAS